MHIYPDLDNVVPAKTRVGHLILYLDNHETEFMPAG